MCCNVSCLSKQRSESLQKKKMFYALHKTEKERHDLRSFKAGERDTVLKGIPSKRHGKADTNGIMRPIPFTIHK